MENTCNRQLNTHNKQEKTPFLFKKTHERQVITYEKKINRSFHLK